MIEGARIFAGSLIDLGRPERNIVVRHVFQIEIFGNLGATGEFLVFPLGRLLQFLNLAVRRLEFTWDTALVMRQVVAFTRNRNCYMVGSTSVTLTSKA